jgi:DNA-binding MarR family transcriptional regulator
MTGLLDRMERGGLVARVADPDDRRVQSIHLTEGGRELRDTVVRLVNETLATLFEGIPEAEIEGMNGVLRKVLANARGDA